MGRHTLFLEMRYPLSAPINPLFHPLCVALWCWGCASWNVQSGTASPTGKRGAPSFLLAGLLPGVLQPWEETPPPNPRLCKGTVPPGGSALLGLSPTPRAGAVHGSRCWSPQRLPWFPAPGKGVASCTHLCPILSVGVFWPCKTCITNSLY